MRPFGRYSFLCVREVGEGKQNPLLGRGIKGVGDLLKCHVERSRDISTELKQNEISRFRCAPLEMTK